MQGAKELRTPNLLEIKRQELLKTFKLNTLLVNLSENSSQMNGEHFAADSYKDIFYKVIEILSTGTPLHYIVIDTTDIPLPEIHELTGFLETLPHLDLNLKTIQQAFPEITEETLLQAAQSLKHSPVPTIIAVSHEDITIPHSPNELHVTPDTLESTPEDVFKLIAVSKSLYSDDTVPTTRRMLQVQETIDLLSLEKKRTNTAETLRIILETIQDLLPEQDLTILEAGTGEGRIAIPLALLGHTVVGTDINASRLVKTKERMLTLAQALTNEGATNNDPLYTLLQQVLPPEQIDDIRHRLKKRLQEVPHFTQLPKDIQRELLAGDFIHALESQLETLTPYSFEAIYEDTPDLIVAPWNFINFTGSPHKMVTMLNRLSSLVKKDGVVIVEIPDPTTGPYPELIIKHTETHPEDLPGIVTAKASPTDKPYSPEKQGNRRYFPQLEEFEHYCHLAGLKVLDVKHYDAFIGEDSYTEVAFILQKKDRLGRVSWDT